MYTNDHQWAGDTPPATDVKRDGAAKHIAKRVAEVGLFTALAFGLIAGSTFAAKGGGGGGGGKHGAGSAGGGATVTLVAPDGTANWGDSVTFAVTTSNAYPVASATCYQGGVMVYGDSHPLYQPNAFNDPGYFVLSSIAWSSGAADCTVVIKGTSNGKVVTLGSASFHVDA